MTPAALPAGGSAVTDGVFAVMAFGALWFGWRVFRTDSMVRASFALLASFLCVAVILVALAAEFLGFLTIFMMAVEMTVMALFMVMFMMNPAGLNPMSMVHQPRTAAAAGLAAFVALAAVALFADLPRRPPPAGSLAAGQPARALGHELLGGSMLVFESIGVTLLAAMLGAVVLSARRGRAGDAWERSLPPPIEEAEPESGS